MKHPKSSLLILLLLLSACSGSGEDSLPGEEALVGMIRSTERLELAEMELTEVLVIEGSGTTLSGVRTLDEAAKYIDNLIRPGGRIGVYAFTHTAVSYLDLSEVTPEDVTIHGQSVTLRLPPIGVILLGRSPDLEVLHERVTGTKRPISSEERKALQDEATERTRERLRPGHATGDLLRRKGAVRATAFYRGMLHSAGYEEVSIIIEEESDEQV